MVVFGQNCCNQVKRLHLGKSGCIRANLFSFGRVVVIGQIGLFGQKWLYSGKMAVIGQNGCIWAKVVNFG